MSKKKENLTVSLEDNMVIAEMMDGLGVKYNKNKVSELLNDNVAVANVGSI